MSSLPASIKKIGSKTIEKRWRHRFPHCKSMGAFCCHGNQSFDPICPKTLCSLSPTPVMLHIRFNQDWPTGFRDIQVWKCGRRRRTTDAGPLVYYKLTLWAFGSGELKNGFSFFLSEQFIEEAIHSKTRRQLKLTIIWKKKKTLFIILFTWPKKNDLQFWKAISTSEQLPRSFFFSNQIFFFFLSFLWGRWRWESNNFPQQLWIYEPRHGKPVLAICEQ